MSEILDTLEVFDAGPEADHVDQIQEALNVLLAHDAELRNMGGVSRPQAAAMVEAGVQFPARAPLNSFSADPSTTNLQIATESLLGAVWGKLRDLARSVLELLRKIFRWIVDNLKRLRPSRKSHEAKVANAAAMAQAVDQLKEAGVGTAELSPSNRAKVAALRTRLNELQASFDSKFHDLIADAVSGGAIASKYRAVLLYLPSVTDLYEQHVAQFMTAVQKCAQAPEEIGRSMTAAGMFSAMAQPQQFPKLNELARRLDDHQIKPTATLAQVATGLKAYFDTLMQTRSYDAPALTAVTAQLSASQHALGASTFLNEDVLVKASERVNAALDGALRALSTFKETQGESPISQAMHAALMTIQAEGNAIQTLVNLGVVIDQAQSDLVDFALQHWTLTYQVSLVFANEADDQTRARAKAVHVELQKKIRH